MFQQLRACAALVQDLSLAPCTHIKSHRHMWPHLWVIWCLWPPRCLCSQAYASASDWHLLKEVVFYSKSTGPSLVHCSGESSPKYIGTGVLGDLLMVFMRSGEKCYYSEPYSHHCVVMVQQKDMQERRREGAGRPGGESVFHLVLLCV